MDSAHDEAARHRLPRSRAEWRARIKDAAHFGERVDPPLLDGADLVHRVALLIVVAAFTGLLAALAISPGVAVASKTVGTLSDRFAGPIGSTDLPEVVQRSVVLDRNGEVIATLAGEENRVYVPLSRVPENAQNAIISIEDAKFFDHHGVDLAGLTRALLFNFRSGSVRQGGSTITQQLVKNTLVGNERSIDRKIREARLAIALEKTTPKRKILEQYLNETYFGNGVYGIGAAAEYYFAVPVEDLTVWQSALLAGIVKAPENYEPIRHAEAAKKRRNLVLGRMADEGFISHELAEKYSRRALGASANPLPRAKTPYFVEYIKGQILNDSRFGATRAERARKIFQAGLRIQTTLDLKLQEGARESVEKILNLKGDPSAALASIDPTTGAIRAVVGGRNFEDQKFDLATQGLRQPGSTFKPITLLAALEAGISPSLTFDTPSPITLKDGEGKDYIVNNYDGRGGGLMDLRKATELSVNSYYVQLIDLIGADKVAAMGQKLGIQQELPPYLSLALGSIAVTPLELASAYATMANEGSWCQPYSITRISTPDNRTVVRNEPNCERRVTRGVAAQASEILRGVITRGTGRKNGQIGRPAAGKTGTTDNYTDAWFAGYTPQYATVVWLGFPESTKKPLKNIHGLPKVYGGSLPAQIWSRYMRIAHKGLAVEPFPKASGTPSTPMPEVTGMALDDARETLKKAGFPTVKTETVRSRRKKGTVVAQDPAAGAGVQTGVVVTLKISDGSAPPPPPPPPSPSHSPSPSPSPSPSVSPSPSPKKK